MARIQKAREGRKSQTFGLGIIRDNQPVEDHIERVKKNLKLDKQGEDMSRRQVV